MVRKKVPVLFLVAVLALAVVGSGCQATVTKRVNIGVWDAQLTSRGQVEFTARDVYALDRKGAINAARKKAGDEGYEIGGGSRWLLNYKGVKTVNLTYQAWTRENLILDAFLPLSFGIPSLMAQQWGFGIYDCFADCMVLCLVPVGLALGEGTLSTIGLGFYAGSVFFGLIAYGSSDLPKMSERADLRNNYHHGMFAYVPTGKSYDKLLEPAVPLAQYSWRF